MTEKYIIVFCTVPDIKTAEKIADILIKKKLAACCNIIHGITSIYMWENKINKDNELLMLIKSEKSLYYGIEQTIKTNHPYEVPEIICSDISAGSKDYLNWISKTVGLS